MGIQQKIMDLILWIKTVNICEERESAKTMQFEDLCVLIFHKARIKENVDELVGNIVLSTIGDAYIAADTFT